ncbi:DsbA family oxidoreductase [Diaphorobacter aerolatus]|uniref:DsbA family protein n=1 Tax=Diaphorobacter aerolatus TaxID=1288495 RepID=A0A7H0GH66_9BURK|nr:DsbA family protein [Diaphorobacter aerolatus]QNP47632.1 DsbA family protein [Diaphorobacter aerolatus]
MTIPPYDPGAAAANELRVDYFLDVICPWCWIGLRNLRSALHTLQTQQPQLDVKLLWHASSLLPHIPMDGVPYQAFYDARLGSREAVLARRAQVQGHADTVGIRIAFDAIERFPNSMLACALVNAAQEQLHADAMFAFLESIYDAYFVRGQDLGDTTVLTQLADAHGVTASPEALLTTGMRQGALAPGGVPHYVFNRRIQRTGAVPAPDLLDAMQEALTHRATA